MSVIAFVVGSDSSREEKGSRPSCSTSADGTATPSAVILANKGAKGVIFMQVVTKRYPVSYLGCQAGGYNKRQSLAAQSDRRAEFEKLKICQIHHVLLQDVLLPHFSKFVNTHTQYSISS